MEIEKEIEVECICPKCNARFKKKVLTIIDVDESDLAPPNYYYP